VFAADFVGDCGCGSVLFGVLLPEGYILVVRVEERVAGLPL